MDNKIIFALIIVVACCVLGGLIYAESVSTQSDNDIANNTTNTTNTTNETNETVDTSSSY